MTALTEEMAMNATPTVTTQQSNWTINKTEGIFFFCISSDFFLTLGRNFDCDKSNIEKF